MDFNPYRAQQTSNSGGAGKGRIEQPGGFENIVWQTRAAAPTDYENKLGDALVACFEEGIDALGPLVERLNAMGVAAPDGAPWTEATFEREMERLGG